MSQTNPASPLKTLTISYLYGIIFFTVESSFYVPLSYSYFVENLILIIKAFDHIQITQPIMVLFCTRYVPASFIPTLN